jgi:phage gpG-like protein
MSQSVLAIRDRVEVDGFAGLLNLVNNMVKVLEEPAFRREQWQGTVEVLEALHEQYFVSATNPMGEAWAPLAPSTVKAKGNAKILIDTQALFQSLTDSGASDAIRELDPDFLLFGTRREWAWVHMYGIDKPGRPVMPARVHTGISEQGVEQVTQVVADASVELMFTVTV